MVHRSQELPCSTLGLRRPRTLTRICKCLACRNCSVGGLPTYSITTTRAVRVIRSARTTSSVIIWDYRPRTAPRATYLARRLFHFIYLTIAHHLGLDKQTHITAICLILFTHPLVPSGDIPHILHTITHQIALGQGKGERKVGHLFVGGALSPSFFLSLYCSSCNIKGRELVYAWSRNFLVLCRLLDAANTEMGAHGWLALV